MSTLPKTAEIPEELSPKSVLKRQENDVPRVVIGDEEKEKGVRRISRRSHEVPIDPSLTDKDMLLPPAMRAKDRSASGDRKSLHENFSQFY